MGFHSPSNKSQTTLKPEGKKVNNNETKIEQIHQVEWLKHWQQKSCVSE